MYDKSSVDYNTTSFLYIPPSGSGVSIGKVSLLPLAAFMVSTWTHLSSSALRLRVNSYSILCAYFYSWPIISICHSLKFLVKKT
jgi:hypothetical protein